MWWKKNKWKVIAPALTIAVLVFAFWRGGDAPGLRGWTVADTPPVTADAPSPGAPARTPNGSAVPSSVPAPADSGTPAPAPTPAETPKPSSEPAPTAFPERGLDAGPVGAENDLPAAQPAGGASKGDAAYSAAQGMALDSDTGKDKYLTDPVPDGMPLPVEPQDVKISDTAYTCTLSVSCATILDNMDWLDTEKVELVPEDGVILPPTEVTFYEGESVFNLLQREMKRNKIHLEFENIPIYNSAYIEGIHNLYEFDCGELSGWTYKVNSWFPNYGCSRYTLQPGDTVEWVFTCDLGADVNGNLSAAGD